MGKRKQREADDGLLVVRDARPSAPALTEVAAAAAAADAPERLLAALLHPLPLPRFEAEVWEHRPCVVQRRGGAGAALVAGLLSKGGVDELLRTRALRYGLHVDVTAYSAAAGRRTLNQGEAVAAPAAVWARYAEGCSVRVLHPQRWCDSLHALLAVLERHFRCAAGCNAYLTPGGTQGFAAHYDDIDAFVVQLEGRKRWRLYAPRCEEERLPRVSSPNFSAAEIGAPLAEVVLEPGDVLYMPRGCIHQAESLPEHHSLHVTLSTGHANTWADLLELALPAALASAVEETPELRRALPRRLLDCVGVMHAPDEEASDGGEAGGELAAQREAFLEHAMRLLRAVVEGAPLDAAADQLGARFMRARLAPARAAGSGGGGGARKLGERARVRLAFAGAARLVVEEDAACVYHPFANDRLGHMEGYAAAAAGEDEGAGEPGKLVFPLEAAPALEALLRTHAGAPLELRALPLRAHADRAALAARLLDAGVLVLVD